MVEIIIVLLCGLFLYGLFRLIKNMISKFFTSLTDTESYAGEVILVIISYFILNNHFGYKKNFTVTGVLIVMVITLLINLIISLTYKITGIMLYCVAVLYFILFLTYARIALSMMPVFIAVAVGITVVSLIVKSKVH
jgi:hypothetical protein